MKILRALLAAATILPVAAPVRAQIATPGQPLQPLGFCQIATLTTSIGFVAGCTAIPTGANAVIMRIEAQAARYRNDGVAPTAAIGIPMLVADEPIFYQGNLTNFRFIESTVGAKLNVQFYKAPQ